MKNTIKIIDLLDKRANAEVLPSKINYDGIWIYEEADDDYYSNSINIYLFGEYLKKDLFTYLNDEVEILDEEEFEDIKPLVLRTFERTGQAITTDRLEDYCDYNFEMIENTIAKIVLNQKKIIERLNDVKDKR